MKRKLAALTVPLVVVAAAAGVAAAEPQRTHADINITLAKSLLAKAQQPVKWAAPGPAFTVPRRVRGKTVYIVAAELNFDFTKQVVRGATQAARLFGMHVKAFDAQGQPANAIRLIQQGISQKAGAIVIISFPTPVVAAAIQAAKKAHIPVINSFEQDSGLPTAYEKKVGVFGEAGLCQACAGREMADAAVALSGGTAFKTTLVNVPSSGESVVQVKAYVAELKRLCTTCEAEIKDVDFAQWGTQLQPTASAAIAGGSQILAPVYDAMIALMQPAVFQSNAADKVKFSSYNATKPVMTQLKTTNLIQADVGGSNRWAGWAVMDQVLRAMSHKPPAKSSKIPNRTFTKANINAINLGADEATWFGKVTFPTMFARLWGAKK
jgi:ribose transport system substrate-binding protein